MVAEVAAATLMLGVGLVHVAPGVVAFAPGRAASVYGTEVANPDLELLLRHRAVLLASTGAALNAKTPRVAGVDVGGLVGAGRGARPAPARRARDHVRRDIRATVS